MNSNLPTGTVTFLFTDIEGSTKLSQEYPEQWESLRARHHEILRSTMDAHNGYVFQIIGDAFCVAFHTALDALNAAVKTQQLLHQEAWSPASIKVRMGINTGTAQIDSLDGRAGVYRGYTTMARVQRVTSVGFGGQILLSNSSFELVRGELPRHISFRDMGEHRLKGLLNPEHLWQVIVPDLQQDFPALQSLNKIPNNLPVQLTSFVGREKEIEQVKHELAEHRLITLTGIGGTGKTRLSLQVAAEVLDQYPDGVWFVELAPLADPALIPHSILAVLHYGEQAGKTPLQVLEEQLNHKKLLLILDNCEHLIEASAKVAHTLLISAPDVKILASSREALGVHGELAWQVSSLTIPDPKSLPEIEQLTQYESVRLFIERASLVQHHFKVDQNTAPAIAQICFRLDGIPLAIELAAARVKALSVDQIARRLDDCFRLLTGGNRTVLERHQTLRAAIDWSYNLLSTEERRLLYRLSVFMGGWTFEAAEQVCINEGNGIDVLELLSHLIDKSLVIAEGTTGGSTRYHMLETTRQYAREKLFESEESEILHNQHLSYFLDFAENGDRKITGPNQAEAIDLLDAERDNFRAALEWTISNQYAESAARLLGALGWAWDVRGYYDEAFSWFEKIRNLPGVENHAAAYGRLLYHMGRYAVSFDQRLDARSVLGESQAIWLRLGSQGETGLAYTLCFLGMNAANNQGDFDKAISFYKQSMELAEKCNNQRVIVAGKIFWGDINYERSDIASALYLYEQSLELSRRIHDLFMIGIAAGSLAYLFVDQGNYEKAHPLYEEQLQINEKLQFRLGIGAALFGLGDLYRHQRDYVRADQHLRKSLSISRDLGLQGNTSFTLYLLSMLALHQNDYSAAGWRFREFFDFARVREEKINICRFLTGISAVAGATNRPEHCAKLYGAAQAALQASKFRMDPFDRAEFDRHIQIASEQLGDTRFEAEVAEGHAMTMEHAIQYALELSASA
jgi:predicted ATPase/class 3 adenylate cyclase